MQTNPRGYRFSGLIAVLGVGSLAIALAAALWMTPARADSVYVLDSDVDAGQSRVDLILVGDSLGMVVLGYENTIPVTMEEMIHHTKAVSRAVKRAFVSLNSATLSIQSVYRLKEDMNIRQR